MSQSPSNSISASSTSANAISATLISNQMTPWSSDQIQQATNGQWQHLERPQQFGRIVTDHRRIQAGDLFLALVGERFDGHDFAADAVLKGAAGIIVSTLNETLMVPQLLVQDTRLALGHLGVYRRQQYPDLTVLALTGSSGKTTVKEMLGSILAQVAPTLLTRGNLNNKLAVLCVDCARNCCKAANNSGLWLKA